MSTTPSRGRTPGWSIDSRRMLHARSVDGRWARILEQRSFHGHVHNVFEHAVNIECADGELYTLCSHELDNAPNTAVVDVAGFSTSGMAVGDPVTQADGELRIGQCIAVAMSEASIWEPSLPRYAGANGNLPALLRRARSHLHRHGARGGMVPKDGESNAFALEVSAALVHRAAMLLDALAQARPASACRHAKSMLGLGPGLTPSGDDFLVGLFAVLSIEASPCHGWLGSGREVVADATSATHPISLAALTAAAEGRVRESISALVAALMYGTAEALIEPLQQVLAIGSTSGADIVAGILSGFELNLQVEASRRRR